MPTQSTNTSERMGSAICSETGCVILYLSLEQLKNITEMAGEVANTEENCDGKDGAFLMEELSECVDRAAFDLSKLFN